jgi:hypothetical protein
LEGNVLLGCRKFMENTKCTRGNAAALKHAGPFTAVSETKESTIERCEGCGDIVIRPKPTGSHTTIFIRRPRHSSEE